MKLPSKITPEQYYDLVTFPLAQMDANSICYDCQRQIDKVGGGRQRDEGIKLLKRIQRHYLDDFNNRAANPKHVQAANDLLYG